jgi:threonine dehydratase
VDICYISGVKRTYCDHSTFLSELCGCKVYLKKDLSQFTGSFKERGARNALLNLTKEQRSLGVVCASAGNHALAMAYHGQGLNIPVTCVMPLTAPLAKVDKCRKFGANIVMHGLHIGDAREHAKREYSEFQYVNGYDHPNIIAGASQLLD